MKPKLAALDKRLKQFLSKQQKENEPLHDLQNTPGYDKFQRDLEAAIVAQGAWTAAQLLDLTNKYITDDLAPLSYEQKTYLGAWMANNLPGVGESMDNQVVYHWFENSFVHGVTSVYEYHNIPNNFQLTSPKYQAAIQSDTNYLLDKSTLDETTRKALVNLITADKDAGMTVKEISADIQDTFPDMAATRADMIARTETVRMVNNGQFAAMKESGVSMKAWLALGQDPCPICLSNAGDDWIPIGSMFGSGDLYPPGHPRCECSLDYQSISLSEADAWGGE